MFGSNFGARCASVRSRYLVVRRPGTHGSPVPGVSDHPAPVSTRVSGTGHGRGPGPPDAAGRLNAMKRKVDTRARISATAGPCNGRDTWCRRASRSTLRVPATGRPGRALPTPARLLAT